MGIPLGRARRWDRNHVNQNGMWNNISKGGSHDTQLDSASEDGTLVYIDAVQGCLEHGVLCGLRTRAVMKASGACQTCNQPVPGIQHLFHNLISSFTLMNFA